MEVPPSRQPPLDRALRYAFAALLAATLALACTDSVQAQALTREFALLPIEIDSGISNLGPSIRQLMIGEIRERGRLNDDPCDRVPCGTGASILVHVSGQIRCESITVTIFDQDGRHTGSVALLAPEEIPDALDAALSRALEAPPESQRVEPESTTSGTTVVPTREISADDPDETSADDPDEQAADGSPSQVPPDESALWGISGGVAGAAAIALVVGITTLALPDGGHPMPPDFLYDRAAVTEGWIWVSVGVAGMAAALTVTLLTAFE